MEGGENEFGKQFAGSAAANVVFMVGLLLYKFFESRCKHSKCSSNTSCFKCNVDNYVTERSSRNITKDAVQSEKSLPKLQGGERQEIQERHIEIAQLELRDPTSLSARERQVVRGEDIV